MIELRECFSIYVPLKAISQFQIFQVLEHPLEEETLENCKREVLIERDQFVRFIFNDSWNSVLHRDNIDRKLLQYEQTVARAANEGINLVTKTEEYKWTYIQAVFFASTILTTIGKYAFIPSRYFGCNKNEWLQKGAMDDSIKPR